MNSMNANPNIKGEAPQSGQMVFGIQRLFLKKAESELVGAPEVFSFDGEWNPGVNFKIDVRSRALPAEHSYEAEVEVKIDILLGEDKQQIWSGSVCHAGAFTLAGIEMAQIDQMLNVYCANVLYPYVRETVDNLLIKSSLPPLMLAPVNFELRYEELMRLRSENTEKVQVHTTEGTSQEEVDKLKAELASLKSKHEGGQGSKVQSGESKSKSDGDNERLKAELSALKAVRQKK